MLKKIIASFLLLVCLFAPISCANGTLFSIGGTPFTILDAGAGAGSVLQILLPGWINASITAAPDKYKAYLAWDNVSKQVVSTLLPIFEGTTPTVGNITGWFQQIAGKDGKMPLSPECITAITNFLNGALSLIPTGTIDKSLGQTTAGQQAVIATIGILQVFADTTQRALQQISNADPSILGTSQPTIPTTSKPKKIASGSANPLIIKASLMSDSYTPPQLKDGDIIVFPASGGYLGTLISFFSGYPYDHSIMYLRGYFYEYAFAGCRKFNDYVPSADVVIMRYKGDLTTTQVDQMIDWWNIRLKSGERYGVELLANLATVRVSQVMAIWANKLYGTSFVPWVKRTSWGNMLEVCSSSIGTDYSVIGIALRPFNPGWDTPADFLISDQLQRIQ